MSHTHPLMTTTFELPGYRAVESGGLVRGTAGTLWSGFGSGGVNVECGSQAAGLEQIR